MLMANSYIYRSGFAALDCGPTIQTAQPIEQPLQNAQATFFQRLIENLCMPA
jgi:hypothetical protein